MAQTFPAHTAAGTNVGTTPVIFKIVMWVFTSHICKLCCLIHPVRWNAFIKTDQWPPFKELWSKVIPLHLICFSVAIYFKWNEQSRATFKITCQTLVLVTENCIIVHCTDIHGLDKMGVWSDVYWTVHHCDSWQIKKPTRCHLLLLFYFLQTQHFSNIL